jgi:hypothetical protein
MNKWIGGLLGAQAQHPINPTIQSSNTQFGNGQRGRSCTWCLRTATTLDPKPGALLLRYALKLRAVLRNAGVEIREAETLGISLAVRFEIGGPEGTCSRQSLHPIEKGKWCQCGSTSAD